MANYKSMFMRYMDVNGIKYVDRDEFVVKVTYSGDNLKSIPVFVFFDKDGDPMVQFKCWEIANFKGKEGQGKCAYGCHSCGEYGMGLGIFFVDETEKGGFHTEGEDDHEQRGVGVQLCDHAISSVGGTDTIGVQGNQQIV
mgnify:CR=1 FL=1